MAVTSEFRKFWEDILIWPGSKEHLPYQEEKRGFTTVDGKTWEVKSGIVYGLVSAQGLEGVESAHLAAHYDRDAREFDYFHEYEDAVTRFEQKKLHERIIGKVPESAKTILDMGCGNAWVAAHFLKKSKQIISADIGVTNIEKALLTYPSENHFGLLADACHLPLRTGSVDVVIASEIMEHVPDPKAFMASLCRVVKPGGLVIITTPYHEKIEYSLCIHCNQPTPRHAHLHSFQEKNIVPLLPSGVEHQLDIFMNKYVLKSRLYRLLAWMPDGVWLFADQWMEKILPGALRFMIVLKKPEK